MNAIAAKSEPHKLLSALTPPYPSWVHQAMGQTDTILVLTKGCVGELVFYWALAEHTDFSEGSELI